MLGMIISCKEEQEIRYLIKREMDEILFDLNDHRVDHHVKKTMEERYNVLFSLFKRLATPKECLYYMPSKRKRVKKG